MNNKIFALVGLVVIVAAAAFFVANQTASKMAKDQSMETTEQNAMMDTTPADTQMMKDETSSDGAMMKKEPRYVEYSKTAFDAAAGKKRVYFFFAPWCPTCVPADKAFQAGADSIPQDVVLFKTDYDSQTALKKQYNVTYQHTFVLVDGTGKELKKWNGGGLEELIANTK